MTLLKALKLVRNTDQMFQMFQDNLAAWTRQFDGKTVPDGLLTGAVALTTAFQNVPHGLGRVPNGWSAVSPDNDVRVWEDSVSNNPDPTKFIRVKGSGSANLKFWVF